MEQKAWIDGRTCRVWQKYLGPEDKLKDIIFNSLLTKHANKVEVQIIEFGISAALWQMAEEINLAGIIDANTGK